MLRAGQASEQANNGKCDCGAAFILLRIRVAPKSRQQIRAQPPASVCVHVCSACVLCLCVRACLCVCVCYMATAAATQRLNLFSTKLNHQKFANNNAGVIYLTHGISLGCLESASRSRSNSDGNGNNNKQRATPQTTMCCSAHNMAKKKKNQPKHTHSI